MPENEIDELLQRIKQLQEENEAMSYMLIKSKVALDRLQSHDAYIKKLINQLSEMLDNRNPLIINKLRDTLRLLVDACANVGHCPYVTGRGASCPHVNILATPYQEAKNLLESME